MVASLAEKGGVAANAGGALEELKQDVAPEEVLDHSERKQNSRDTGSNL